MFSESVEKLSIVSARLSECCGSCAEKANEPVITAKNLSKDWMLLNFLPELRVLEGLRRPAPHQRSQLRASRRWHVVRSRGNLSFAVHSQVTGHVRELRIPPGAVVGIIGPNGAGKTTLFKMIMGKAGTSRMGWAMLPLPAFCPSSGLR